ncbi:hypothetical protein HW35_01500 [Bacillus sp. X1(2014)]|nr:hypothetical protein HW35_01500 [Bacillus sp. X1(2014)]
MGAFILNGENSVLGKLHHSPLVWNEPNRYDSLDQKKGIFKINKNEQQLIRCQPYLLRFNDFLNLKGKYINSDDLYFKLGKFPSPLPPNAMAKMGFCTLTPKETEIALDLIYKSNEYHKINNNETIVLDEKNIMYFNGKLNVDNIGDT